MLLVFRIAHLGERDQQNGMVITVRNILKQDSDFLHYFCTNGEMKYEISSVLDLPNVHPQLYVFVRADKSIKKIPIFTHKQVTY